MPDILSTIKGPNDLKKLSPAELRAICCEIRNELITVVSHNGGHLASNLGAVELTVALHRVFEAPNDSIVFDVGHQCYTHKLLTGRYDRFSTLRLEGGIAGFPRPSESDYDLFVAGHSSQALSAAIGLARSKQLDKDPSKVVVVVGDGAFSGGMIFEAINNIDPTLRNLIVVLNDNSMSISKSVGNVARYLLRLRTDAGYTSTKKRVQLILDRIPFIGKPIANQIKRFKALFRRAVFDGHLFEALGFGYVGAINGHDLSELIRIFSNVKKMDGPMLVHVITSKGKGYKPAEENPGAYHGVGSFDVDLGNPDITLTDSFSNCFGRTLCGYADGDSRICAVTAAMKYATGLNYFGKKYPDRFFDVGIAEEHATTFCAGLAKGGKKPVFAVYSTFLQRAYDQLLHDVVLGNMDVMLAIDRAGIVGEDGETHQGIFDVAYLTSIGAFTIASPSNYSELEYWTLKLLRQSGPRAVRYPRGEEDKRLESYSCSGADFDFIENGSDLLIVTYGRIFAEVLDAKILLENSNIKTSVLKLNVISPIPPEALRLAGGFDKIIFVEEGIVSGGANEHFLRELSAGENRFKYLTLAINTPIVKHASVAQSLKSLGLDAESISQAAQRFCR